MNLGPSLLWPAKMQIELQTQGWGAQNKSTFRAAVKRRDRESLVQEPTLTELTEALYVTLYLCIITPLSCIPALLLPRLVPLTCKPLKLRTCGHRFGCGVGCYNSGAGGAATQGLAQTEGRRHSCATLAIIHPQALQHRQGTSPATHMGPQSCLPFCAATVQELVPCYWLDEPQDCNTDADSSQRAPMSGTALCAGHRAADDHCLYSSLKPQCSHTYAQ